LSRAAIKRRKGIKSSRPGFNSIGIVPSLHWDPFLITFFDLVKLKIILYVKFYWKKFRFNYRDLNSINIQIFLFKKKKKPFNVRSQSLKGLVQSYYTAIVKYC
jgi:hypothetical protein